MSRSYIDTYLPAFIYRGTITIS